MVLTQSFCMEKPVFIFGFNDKTNICVKTIRCENTIRRIKVKYNNVNTEIWKVLG